jgi:hypothetical protein
MASKRKVAGLTVDAFLAALDHSYKAEILALRQLILAADPSIREGIKWNAPSFHTTEYFATFHLRAKAGVQLILHLGAKVRDNTTGMTIADPQSLLTWLAKERASISFHDLAEIRAQQTAFQALIRAWIVHV